MNEGHSSEHSNQLESTLMYYQIFHEIFLETEHNERSTRDIIRQQDHQNNATEAEIIDEFTFTYQT